MLKASRHLASGTTTTLGVLFLAGCALIAATTLAAADSTPRRLYRGTHVGAAPADLVVLTSSGTGSNLKFLQVRSDGSTDTNEYAVPAGFRLVVTDVDWSGSVGITLYEAMLRIWIENKSSPTTRSVVYLRHDVARFTSSSGSQLPVGGTSGTLTGFTVSSSVRLTADVGNGGAVTAAYPATLQGGANNQYQIILRGYLTPDA